MNYEVSPGYGLADGNLLDYPGQQGGSLQAQQENAAFGFQTASMPAAQPNAHLVGGFPAARDVQAQRQPGQTAQDMNLPILNNKLPSFADASHSSFVPVSSNPEAYSLTAQTPPQSSGGPLASFFLPPFSPAASLDTPNSEYSMSTDTSSITSWMSSASSYSSPFSVKSSADHRHLIQSQAYPSFWPDPSVGPFPQNPQNDFSSPAASQQAFTSQPAPSANFRLQTPPVLYNSQQQFNMSPVAQRRYASALSNGREALPPLSLGVNNFGSQYTSATNYMSTPGVTGQVDQSPAPPHQQQIGQPAAAPQEESTAVEKWVEQRTKKALSALSTMLSVLHSLEEVVNTGQRISVQERVEKTTSIDRAWVELQTNLLTEDSHPPPEVTAAKAAPLSTPLPLSSVQALEAQQGSASRESAALAESLSVTTCSAQAGYADDADTSGPLQSAREIPPAQRVMPLLTHTRSSPNLLANMHSGAPTGLPVSSNTPFTDAAVAGQRVPMLLDGGPTAPVSTPHISNTSQDDFDVLHRTSLEFQHAIAFRRANDWAQQMAMQPDQSTPSAPPTPYSLHQPQYDIVQSTPSSPGPHSNTIDVFSQLDALPNFPLRHQPTNPRLYDHKLTVDTTGTGTAPYGFEGLPQLDQSSQQEQDQQQPDGLSDMLAARISRSTPSSPTASTHASFATLKRKRSNTLGTGIQKHLVPMSPMAEEEEHLVPLHASSDVPSGHRERLDDVFVEWLNDICNDLEATDSKGEPIHQVLMPKKMQRLEESKDFRPFKFRIQAFTNSFIDKLTSRDFTTEEVSGKLIRSYLWTQPLISRFNEEGKKAKSKGNHVWTVDARRTSDTTWEFRPFERRIIAPSPLKLATDKLFQWEPRVWDPIEGSIRPASCSFTRYPFWLSVRQNPDQLIGTPTVEGTAEVQATAVVMTEGQLQEMQASFELSVAQSEAS